MCAYALAADVRTADTRMDMFGAARVLPSIGVGMALGSSARGERNRVHARPFDGDDDVCSWRRSLAAHLVKLDNLIAIVDVNNQQADGPSSEAMGFELVYRQAQGIRMGTPRRIMDGSLMPCCRSQLPCQV